MEQEGEFSHLSEKDMSALRALQNPDQEGITTFPQGLKSLNRVIKLSSDPRNLPIIEKFVASNFPTFKADQLQIFPQLTDQQIMYHYLLAEVLATVERAGEHSLR